jgi:putative toxin-antitoxin system antitoxin component (TIGR02293 family)
MSTQTQSDTARILGLSPPSGQPVSPMWISHAVTDGLPITALDSVIHHVAPDDKSFAYRVIPRPTLARRRHALQTRSKPAQAVLSPEEGSKVARLAEVWAMARDVWGSDAEARAFLFRPHPLLEGQKPIDVVLATEFGRPLVENILGRLQYGSAV